MKKLICLILTAILLLSLIVPASAATESELQDQISACQIVKDTAHQMAECARQLGFDDSHVIIQTAKQKWEEANTQQQDFQKQLEEMQKPAEPQEYVWNGPKLTKSKGVNYGPTGKETYYNLNMSGVVRIMRRMGYDEANYPYWVRADGAKMLGPYVMVAANLNHFPRGSIVPCSLGLAIVCDTGGFASRSDGWNWLDVATNWR